MVASVFLQPCMASGRQTSVLARILRSILLQVDPICEDPGLNKSLSAKSQPRVDLDELGVGGLREALVGRLRCFENAFLVIDGVDYCAPDTTDMLEDLLSSLQASGLKVVSSTRGLPLRLSDMRWWEFEFVCDGNTTPDCGNSGNPLDVFWICQSDHEIFVMCPRCRAEGLHCAHW